jgi:hypothetical protein
MIPLAFCVAILDGHTRFTHLETDTPLNAALGTAGVDLMIHPTTLTVVNDFQPDSSSRIYKPPIKHTFHDGDEGRDYSWHGLLPCGVAVKAIPTTELL